MPNRNKKVPCPRCSKWMRSDTLARHSKTHLPDSRVNNADIKKEERLQVVQHRLKLRKTKKIKKEEKKKARAQSHLSRMEVLR